MTGRRARFPVVTEAVAGMLATPLWYLGAWIIITGLLLVAPVLRGRLLSEDLHQQASAAEQGAYVAVITPRQSPVTGSGRSAGDDGAPQTVEAPGAAPASGTPGQSGASPLTFADCQRISRSPGITGVGAVGAPVQAVPVTAPSGTISLYPVSRGLLSLLSVNPSQTAGHLVVGGLVASELGLRDGSTIALRVPGTGTVSAPVIVLPTMPGRTAGFDRAVLAIAPPTRPASACWVQTAGIDPNTFAQWAAALLGGTSVDVAPLATPPAPSRTGLEPVAALAEGVAALVALTAWILIRRLSRDEVLLNRIAGVSWPALILHDTARWLTLCICSVPIAVVTCMAVDANTAAVDFAFFATYVRDIGAVTAAAILTRSVASLRRGWEWRALRFAS